MRHHTMHRAMRRRCRLSVPPAEHVQSEAHWGSCSAALLVVGCRSFRRRGTGQLGTKRSHTRCMSFRCCRCCNCRCCGRRRSRATFGTAGLPNGEVLVWLLAL